VIDVFSNLEEFDGEEPWCDLLFEIDRATSSFFLSRTNFHHVGVWQGRPVGFSALWDAAEWKFVPAQDERSIPLWWGYVTLSGDGPQGDSLCALWRSYFKIEGPSKFVNAIRCQAVALEGDPTKLKSGVVQTKLFFDNGDPDEYAELYYNLDLDARLGALNEKDPAYRALLVKWISGEVGHA
jgi:hypothetical protein